MSDHLTRQIVEKLYATEPNPFDVREELVATIAAELSRHTEHFRDGDRVDRGSLNCKCGARIPPRQPVPYRDWPAWEVHIAEAVVKAMEGDGESGQDRESYTDTQDRESYTVRGES